MNFFEHQRLARRNSKLLIALFVLAVIITILANYLLIQFAMDKEHQVQLWNPNIFFMVAPFISLIIFIGSISQYLRYSGGGDKVATSLGGRLVSANSNEPKERQALNIVEEMAIASGIPIPSLYLLDHVDGINAFASGSTVKQSVVAISKGCLNQLNRDELQGVIAHEFSHILNGDMKLNIRLLACVAGLSLLSEIGLLIARLNDRKKGNLINVVGIGVYFIGIIGTFLGTLIQLGLSRQREFLADSSAVQFTRQTDGIANALKKISQVGSKIDHAETHKFAHVFFSDGISRFFGGIFSTHPDINVRIKRLDPKFIPLSNSITSQNFKASFGNVSSISSLSDGISGLETKFDLTNLTTQEYINLIYLVLARNNSITINNLELSNNLITILDNNETLALLELCLERLKILSPNEKTNFLNNCRKIAEADRKYDLFELLLNSMLINRLTQGFIINEVSNFTKEEAIEALIICFATKTNNPVDPIYEQLGIQKSSNPHTITKIPELIDVLETLNLMKLSEKELLFDALILASERDQIISKDEGLLIRIIGLSLGVPVPLLS